MFPVLAATTDTQFGTGRIVVGLVALVIWIFLAYKCAGNRRWLLFILGFFCGILRILGWAVGPRRTDYRY